jgi:hypothetical protein
MTPATAGVIDAACSVRRRSISVQAAAGGSRRAALARPVRPFVSRASSRVAHIAPPGHPREASPTLTWLARCVVAPRHAPGGVTGRSSGAPRSRTAAAPWLAYRHTRRLLMAVSSGPTSAPSTKLRRSRSSASALAPAGSPNGHFSPARQRPARSRPSPRTRELSSGCSSPHARAPHGPVDPRQQPVPGSCDSSLVSRASWPWMNRRRVDGDDLPNDQPHDVDAGERHERPIPPPIAELLPEEWLRRCLHPLCDHHPTVLSLRHARSLPASAAAIAPHRPIARGRLVPPDRERAVPIPVEPRCPAPRLDRASQHSPCRETAQLR